MNHYLSMLLFVGSPIALLGALLLTARREPSPVDQPNQLDASDISLGWVVAAGCAALAIRLSLLWWSTRQGFILSTNDESARFEMIIAWWSDPGIIYAEGFWLVGSFIYYQIFFSLFGDTETGMMAAMVVNHAIVTATIGSLGWVLARRRWAAAMAMLLTATTFLFIDYGHGPLAELPVTAAIVAAVACGIRMLQRLDSPRVWAYALPCGLLFFIAQSVHLTAWMFTVAVWPVAALVVFVNRKNVSRAGFAAFLVATALAATYPWIQFYGSWQAFGSPTGFLKNQSDALAYYLQERGDTPSLINRLFVYPGYLIARMGPLLLLGLFVLLPVRHDKKRQRAIIIFLLALTAALSTMIASSLSSGWGNPNRSLFVTIGLLLAALPAMLISREAALWHSHGKPRAAILVAFALIVFGSFLHTGIRTFDREDGGGTKIAHDQIAMANWIKQEIRRPQTLVSCALGRLPIWLCEDQETPEKTEEKSQEKSDVPPTFYGDDKTEVPDLYRTLVYIAGKPHAMQRHTHSDWLKIATDPNAIDLRPRVVIYHGTSALPPEYKQEIQIGTYRVFSRRPTAP